MYLVLKDLQRTVAFAVGSAGCRVYRRGILNCHATTDLIESSVVTAAKKRKDRLSFIAAIFQMFN